MSRFRVMEVTDNIPPDHLPRGTFDRLDDAEAFAAIWHRDNANRPVCVVDATSDSVLFELPGPPTRTLRPPPQR
jgi:hypothetical protein